MSGLRVQHSRQRAVNGNQRGAAELEGAEGSTIVPYVYRLKRSVDSIASTFGF